MPSGAPTDADYILAATNALLPNARLIDAGGLLIAMDGGPGGDFEISLDQANLILANLPALDAELQAEYLKISLLTTNGDLLTRSGGVPARLGIGSAGQVLTVSGGAPAWTTPAAGGVGGLTMPLYSGLWVATPTVSAALTTTSPSANTMTIEPLFLPTTTTFDRIGIEQTGTGAANYQLGVYGPITGTLSGSPLAFDAGSVASTGAALLTITINQTLAAGWYLLVVISDQARTQRAYATGNFPGVMATTTQAARPAASATVAQSYGALPSTVPAGLTLQSSASVPIISLRVA